MKKIILLVAGAIALYQVARKFEITTVEDIRHLVGSFFDGLHPDDLLNMSEEDHVTE